MTLNVKLGDRSCMFSRFEAMASRYRVLITNLNNFLVANGKNKF